MSRQNAIENLLERLAVAKGDAYGLGLDLAAYLLNVAMLQIITGPCASRIKSPAAPEQRSRHSRQSA
jgi:hypothetical protein